jgi:H+/Cl- antiporter ClcA
MGAASLLTGLGDLVSRTIAPDPATVDTVRRRVATGIGAVVLGLVALAFARGGDLAREGFQHIVAAEPYAPLVLTPAMFAAVVWLTRRYVPEARGSGIPQVMAAARRPEAAESQKLVSLRAAGAKIGLTLAILLAGGSAGREGPTVQLSAAIMVAVHRVMRVPLSAGVYIAGGAAGVAAAFNTPLAGVAFAIEELAAAYEQRVAILVMGAVMIAGMVSLGVAGDYVYFGSMRETLPLRAVLLAAPAAGIVGGVAGGLFSRLVLGFASGAGRWQRRLTARPVLFAALCGLIVAALGLASGGLTWGTGYDATKLLVEDHGQPLWFGPAKFVAALATALSGAPGGIFAPSLAVGAGVGNLLTPLFPGDPAGAIVLLGVAGYFVGVVRAPLTAVIIITEATNSRGMIVPLFFTALIAEVASTLVCRERLYHGLAKGFGLPGPEVPDQSSAGGTSTAS